MTKFNVNDPIKGGLTLLHYACRQGYINIVRYLLNEKNANVNRQVDSITPLMEACCYDKKNNEEHQDTVDIVKLLIQKKCVINISDKYGMTPLMYACKYGLHNVIEILLKNFVSLEAKDNYSYTALHYAVENNHPKCVKLLIDANINIECVNYYGFTARQIAEFNNYEMVLNVFPLEPYKYYVPSNYLSYNNIKEEIPRIFKHQHDHQNHKLIIKNNNFDHENCGDNPDKDEQPEYFPDIHDILLDMKMEKFLEKFSFEKITLEQFLIITNEKLKDIQIEYPIHRKKILYGILQYVLCLFYYFYIM